MSELVLRNASLFDPRIGVLRPGVGVRVEVLPAAEVLRQATLEGARVPGREGELGQVTPGARADLVVVDGDPPRALGLLGGAQGERQLAVVKDGELAVDRLGALA